MKTKKINFCILILTLFIAATILPSAFRAVKTDAATSATGERVLPVSDMELTKLNTPKSVAYKNGNYAVIVSDGLFVYINEQSYKIPLDKFAIGGISQVRFFSNETLFVSNFNIIKKITFTQSAYSIEELKYKNDTVSCTCFDVNDKFLITSSGNTQGTYKVYQIENGIIDYRFTRESSEHENINGDNPIALNEENIFFVANQSVQTRKTDDTSNPDEILTIVPDNMIANEQYLYYIKDYKIYRVSVNGGEPQNLIPDKWFNDGENYDLGKLVSPTGLCFKNGNLLISDSSLNAVQEFKIVNDKLEFTGFAIAESGKSAYNRIGAVKKLDRYGERVAALSDYKLTVMTIDNGFDGYNKANFKNYFANETTTPKNFALGKSALIAVTDVRKITCINLDDDAETFVEFTDGEGAIKDVTYQSGIFYVLTHNGNDYKLFSVAEKDFFCDREKHKAISAGESVAVDVFGTPIVNDEYGELSTDLSGKVFGLKNDKLYECKNGAWTETGLDGITTFAMNFDEKTVYYANENAEHLYSTDDLDNLAISSLIVPDGYSLKGETAKTIETYKIKDETANVYDFSIDKNGVKFKDIIERNDDGTYVFLAKAENADICFMASENGAVLIAERNLERSPVTVESVDKDVYITTGVHAYCLPVVTQNNLYVINRGNADVTLDKNARVKAKGKLSVYGREFYLVTVGKENAYDCYVPAGFTVDELYGDYVYSDYRLEKVKKTAVYSDAQLTEEIGEIEKNSQVRVISQENGVCQIAYLVDGEFKEGYIKSSAIINEAKISVRNVLIVLATIACACGTATYFILRKRAVD